MTKATTSKTPAKTTAKTTKATAPSKTTAVARAKVALPTNVDDMIKADVAKLSQQLAAPTGKTIQVTQSKEFRFPDGSKVTDFRGVIVDFVSVNSYYENVFNPDEMVPPNCFAIGVVKNDDLKASNNSPDPQNAEGDNQCKDCWANAWKSGANGKGKACKNSIKAAVLCEDGEVRPLTFSPTALKSFGTYVRDVVQAYGVSTYGVMTEFSFDTDFDFSSVRCACVAPLNEEQLAAALFMRDDAHAMLTTEPDVSEFEAKVVAKRNKPKGKAAPAKGRRAA